MTSIAKILLVGAVAVTAIAISAAPSEAAKRMKAPAPCTPGMLCTAPAAGVSKIMACGGDGKWYQAIFTPWCVTGTICPATCS
jgi:hypothetical protein